MQISVVGAGSRHGGIYLRLESTVRKTTSQGSGRARRSHRARRPSTGTGKRSHTLEPDRDEHPRRLPRPAEAHRLPCTSTWAWLQGAVYDAVNATTPKHHRPYLLKRRFGATSSQDAAAATAAYRVLTEIALTVPPTIAFPNRASVVATLKAEYAASLSGIPESPFKKRGIAAGNAAADAMIAARQGDGRFGASQWVPNSAPGHWQPLLNPDGTPMLDPTPWIGGVRPFPLQSQPQFRTPGPAASAAYAAEFNEVKALGSVNSAVRTPEHARRALLAEHGRAGAPLERRRR